MIRTGVIRKGIQALLTTFQKRRRLSDSNVILHLTHFVEGKGRIKDKSAWFIKNCVQKPTEREIDLIIRGFIAVSNPY